MTIVSLTSTGAVRIPKHVLAEIGDPEHLQLRVSSSGISLTPVRIQSTLNRKAVPEIPRAASAPTPAPVATPASALRPLTSTVRPSTSA